MKDLHESFETLEISPDASYEEAKAAYRDLVSVWHPDKHGHNERLQVKATKKLKNINAAWSTLEAHYREKKGRDERESKDRGRQTKEREAAERAEAESRARDETKFVRLSCPHCGTVNRILRESPFASVSSG